MHRRILYALALMVCGSVAHAQTLNYTPPAYLIAANVNGIPTLVASTATTGVLSYQPPTFLAKCMNAGQVVDCAFGGSSSGSTVLSGTVTLAIGSTSTPVVTFATAYTSAPVCLWDTQNATTTVRGSIGFIAAQVSTTQTYATVSTAPAANITLGYHCF